MANLFIIAAPSGCGKTSLVEALIKNLSSKDTRDRMAKEMNPSGYPTHWLTNFKKPHNKKYEGLSVNEIAAINNQEPSDTIFDLLFDIFIGLLLCSNKEIN